MAPQYPAGRNVTIRQLLDMTSRIPDYAIQPAFVTALAAAPAERFSAARLVSYVTGLPLSPAGYSNSDTNYILVQMIIEKVTHDSYAEQLTRRIINPLGLRSMCYAPYTCPAADATRIPTGYFEISAAPSLLGQPMPPLALTWAQGAGAIVSSLQDMTTWDRDLYLGRELPPRQQRQLESLVSETTGKPISTTTPADPAATDSASSSSPTSPSEWYGPTKAAPSATGPSTTTSPTPASSSPSPSTVQPTQPTTNSARSRSRPTRPSRRQAQCTRAEQPGQQRHRPGLPGPDRRSRHGAPADRRLGSQPVPDPG
jgi:CubicO group peptidase (beta-lactamase class C family)